MLTKNQLKHIRSLGLKKSRDAAGAFVAEGPKVVEELSRHLPCRQLFGTPTYLQGGGARPRVPSAAMPDAEIVEITEKELRRASFLKTPHDVLAIFERPREREDLPTLARIPAQELTLALDGVQDPGNLGTIVRIADWFGIRHVFCSPDTADAYSPKTVQATMGAVGRVGLHYLSLTRLLDLLPTGTPVFGTFLDGMDIRKEPLARQGVIVMGNEGNGISDELAALVTRRLLIPGYPPGRRAVESLNVAVATAITCAEFRRRC